ncbi:MAG: ATP-binding protein [Pseudomonadota bacterium]|nr:ATP-binding protein [Pseudomonadota bacterium]
MTKPVLTDIATQNPQTRIMLDENTDVVLLSDSSGRIIDANSHALKLLGYSQKEIRNLFISNIDMRMNDPSCAFDIWRSLSDRPIRVEGLFRCKNDSTFPVEISISRLRHAGEEFVLIIARDISNYKQAEDDFRIAQMRAEQASAAKSMFLARMSHELRTPLNAIILYTDMLLEDVRDRGHDDLASDVEKIRISSHLLLDLINDVLDISRIEAGIMDLNLEMVDLDALVQDVIATTRPLIEHNRNKFIVKIPNPLPLMNTDPVKLRQCLVNLLGNAAKFTKDGFIVLLVSVGKNEAGDTLIVKVVDNGIGISPEALAGIFDPFRQAGKTIGAKYGGSGLGLTICHRIIDMLGGILTVESRAGSGATFIIRLPIEASERKDADLQPSEQVSDAPRPAPVPPPRVLVVGDDPGILILAPKGEEIRCADSVEVALKIIKNEPAGLIFLDYIAIDPESGKANLNALIDQGDQHGLDIVTLSSLMGQNGHIPGIYTSTTPHLANEIQDDVRELLSKLPLDVMIVDDDVGTRDALTKLMARNCLVAIGFAEGEQALRALRIHPSKTVILDLMMPGMTGLQMLLAMRNDPDLSNIPVIVMTGKDVDRTERKLIDQKADGFLHKGGYSPDDLVRLIKSCMTRNDDSEKTDQNDAEKRIEP